MYVCMYAMGMIIVNRNSNMRNPNNSNLTWNKIYLKSPNMDAEMLFV